MPTDSLRNHEAHAIRPASFRLSPLTNLGRCLALCAMASSVGCWTSHSDLDSSRNIQSSNNKPAVNTIRFVEVAESSGVHWIGRTGEEAGLFAILETLGTGCAIDDYDFDGRLDLFFAGGGQFGSHQEILPLPIALYPPCISFCPLCNLYSLPVPRYTHRPIVDTRQNRLFHEPT